MSIKKSNKVIKAELRQKIRSLEAQLIHHHYFASLGLPRASIDGMTGSSVVLSLSDTSGKSIVDPIAIRDGLSDETIAALQKDIQRSFYRCTEFKP